MPRLPLAPHSRRHIMIFDDDWEFLITHFGPGSRNPIGASRCIQAMVRKECARLRGQMAQALDRAEPAEPSGPNLVLQGGLNL